MKNVNFLPILLGSDENAYGCARLFYSEYNIKPLLLCARPLPPTSYSRILTRRVIKALDTEATFNGIMKEFLPILKRKAKKLLVIPCSDYYTELTVKNRDLISRFSEMPIITKELYASFKDKAAFYNLCEKHGLPYPETLVLTAEELLTSPKSLGFPTVIKPINSNSFSYLHLDMVNKKKVYFCESNDEIKKISETLLTAGYREPLIVQRFIPGDRALVINAYCDKDARVRLIGAARSVLEYRSPSLIGNYAALKTVKNRHVCDIVISFLEKIGYVGLVNFDLKYDESRGEYLFFELNPRQGRSSYYIHTAGENLMKAVTDDAILGNGYSGVTYAEREGVWSNIPFSLLKRHAEPSVIKSLPRDTAITPFYDLSLPRAYTLLKRDIHAARLLK